MGRPRKDGTTAAAPANPGTVLIPAGHGDRAHAWCSPSALERRLACPASAAMEAAMPPEARPTSGAAAWGTAGHEKAEKHLMAWTDPVADDEHAAMLAPYLGHVRARMGGREGAAQGRSMLVEHRVDIYAPDCFGTLDAAVVDPFDLALDVADLKTGAGECVNPEDNIQLGAYAIGTLRKHVGPKAKAWDGWTVTLTIAQARRHDGKEAVQTWTAPLPWLADLEKRIKSACKESRKPNPPTVAGAHCGWCKAAAVCPARLNQAASVFPVATAADVGGEDPGAKVGTPIPPASLDPASLSRVLDLAPEIRAWLDSVEAHALANPPPGRKVVEGKKGPRRWTDPAATVAALRAMGLNPHGAPPIRTPADVEKEMGKPAFREGLAAMTESAPGKPTLVLDSDPRPAISYAASFPADPGVEA